MTVDGFPVQVRVTGPEKGPYVVVLGAAQHAPAAYDTLCERLHIAAVRTVVIGADPRLHPKAVVAVLDTLEVPWAVLVGDRFGAELAWELAAARPDRFTGLVVIDRGHPRVPDPHGVVHDPDCPPVEINTKFILNTFEQFTAYFIANAGLAMYCPIEEARTLPILTGLFVLGRILFWVGYHKNPYLRAFGFGVTFYPTVIAYVWLVLIMVFGIRVPL